MKIGNIIAALAIVGALGLPATELGAQDWLEKGIDALYDTRDRLQDVANKSIKGVAAAMNEGGTTRQPRPGESTIDYNLRKYDHYDKLYKSSAARHKGQQDLLNIDAKILALLPKGDPRRMDVMKRMGNMATQQSGSKADMNKYSKKVKDFDKAIQRHKKRTGAYPAHDCPSAPGWHLPAGAKCSSSNSGTSAHAGKPAGH